MDKIRIMVGETLELTQEQAVEYFAADAENLELIQSENGYRGIIHCLSENIIQSAVIEENFNIANIDKYGEDRYEDCKDIIEIVK